MINGHKHESERIAHTEEKHHSRIAHTEEKHLPGGWVVLKFGGTSVGKFAENIAGIVK
jgi:aspartate kinase